jgi:membrane protease YdiL (CAAX protease family)
VLSEKPWKLEAIARLLIGVFICMCIGSLLGTALYHGPGFQKHSTLFFIVSVIAFIFLVAALVELGKPWAVENFRRRVGITFALFYPGLMLLAWANQLAGTAVITYAMGQMLIGVLSLQGAVVALTWRMLRQQGISWDCAFGFSEDCARAVRLGIVVAVIFLPIGFGLQLLSDFVMRLPHSPVQPVEQQAVQTLRTAASWLQRLAAGTVTIIVAPLGEELLFRGILYPTIKQAGFRQLALWATSLAFAAIHLNAVTFASLLVLSVLLTLLYEKTNNLIAPIAAHSVFNTIQFVWLYIQQYLSQKHEWTIFR